MTAPLLDSFRFTVVRKLSTLFFYLNMITSEINCGGVLCIVFSLFYAVTMLVSALLEVIFGGDFQLAFSVYSLYQICIR